MPTTQTHQDRVAGGRPLDHQRDTALRRAALELVGEIGYDRMTIEAVAARARAGKATVYRRWPSKAELVIDAFVNEAMGPAVPDTGSLRGDVIALATRLWEDSGPIPRTRVMVGLVSAMLTHPELREAMASISRPPKVVLEEILRRAVERGELPEMVGLDLPGTIVPAMCMFRVVTTGEPPTSEFIENVVDQVLMPALTAGATGPRRRRVSSSPKGD